MNRLGVCSWSLPARSAEDMVGCVLAVDVDCVQLALDPLGEREGAARRTMELLESARIEVRSGMMAMRGEDYSTLESIRRTGGVRPDEHWEENRRAAAANAGLARELGISLVSFHAGFLPETAGPERAKMVERLRAVVDLFGEHDVRCALESGQESADTLLAVLDELGRPTAGVNFDPANMILYDRDDPLDALERLAPRVLQIHVKDARRTLEPGTWGQEVPAGEGDVDWPGLFELLRRKELGVDLLIEREAGAKRIRDVRFARELVLRHLAVAVHR
jgi:sugar phosphate isomerase/epimerase